MTEHAKTVPRSPRSKKYDGRHNSDRHSCWVVRSESMDPPAVRGVHVNVTGLRSPGSGSERVVQGVAKHTRPKVRR